MLEEHLNNEQLAAYRNGALPPLELLQADDHLAECAACRNYEVAPETHLALRAALAAPDGATVTHLAYEEIEALVDGTLDDVAREIVSGHLAVCASCTEEARDLAVFRAELATETEAETQAAPLSDLTEKPARPQVINVGPPVQVGFDSKRRGWWGRLRSRLANPSDWSFLEAGALALLALAAVGGLAWYARRTDQKREIAQTTQPSSPVVPLTPAPLVPLTMDTPSPATIIPPTDTITPATPPAPMSNGPFVVPPLPGAPPVNVAPPAGSTPPLNLPPLEATYVARLNDGAQGITLDHQGQLTGTSGLAPDAQQAVKAALEKQQIEATPLPAELAGTAGVLLSGKPDANAGVPFNLQGPLRKIVRTDKPNFRWQAVPNAQSYTVAVSDQNFTVIATSGNIKGTSWQPAKPLPRGGVYSWQVTANTPDTPIISPRTPAPEAKFKVLEADQARILDQAQKQYAQSHLILGIFYARAGLLEDAEQEFKALLNANPTSPVARNLLKEIQKARK